MRTEPPSFSIPLLFGPALFALGAIGMMIAAHSDKDVASREQSTTGMIVSHEPRNHNRYGYKFQVSGQHYTGSETPLKAEPRIGQSVTVYFDPLDPAENALTDFAELGDRLFVYGIGVLIFSGFFVGVVLLFDLTISTLVSTKSKSSSSNVPRTWKAAP
jgi:hypothetical protein